MATIGLTNLHYAIMTTEDTATTAPVYTTPKRLVGVNSVSISPENDTATLYGDNTALATVSKTKKRTITLEIADLPPEDKAAILGHSYDSNTKVMSVNAEDNPPYVAIMHEVNNHKGQKEYHVFYKGKFAPAQEDINTEGESLEFGLHTLEGDFVSRTDNGKIEDVKYADGTDTTIATTFFASVGGGLA